MAGIRTTGCRRSVCRHWFVTGTDDVVIPPVNAVTLSERIPGARLVQFPGAGHGLMYQCPMEFAKVVREFLGILS